MLLVLLTWAIVWFTNLYHKERRVSIVQQFCLLDHFLISMSIITMSETILLLFHCQMLNIFFITTSGFKHLVQITVTLWFVLCRRELYYEFEKKGKKKQQKLYSSFFSFLLFIRSVCPRQGLKHSATPSH